MPTDIRDVIKKMTPGQRKKIKARAAELIAEELTLQELRKARNITQTNLSKLLGIGQDQISKMEKCKDLELSTIAEYVEAIGGSFSLVVDFPDGKSVVLAGMIKPEPPKGRGRSTVGASAIFRLATLVDGDSSVASKSKLEAVSHAYTCVASGGRTGGGASPPGFGKPAVGRLPPFCN